MLALVVVEAEPGANTSLGLGNGRIGVEVHLLVFEASPQSLHEDVVHAAALAVHADRYAVALQRAGEVVTGELAALVSIGNLESTIPGERFLERLDTRLSTERVRQPPRQYGAAHPVHDDDEVEEALGHRDIGNVRAPDLVDPLDRDAPEQIRVDFVRRSCLARARSLIDRHQRHEPHQTLHAFAIDEMALGGQPRRHPARTVVGPGQILPIDQHHDCMLLLADRRRLAVNRGARYRQQPALLRNRQYQVLTLDQRATFGSAHLPSFRDKKSFSTFNWPICGTGHRPVPRWPRPQPDRRPPKHPPRRPAAASSNYGSDWGEPRTHWPDRQSSGRP